MSRSAFLVLHELIDCLLGQPKLVGNPCRTSAAVDQERRRLTPTLSCISDFISQPL